MDEQEKLDRDIQPDTVAIPEAEVESTPAGQEPPRAVDVNGKPVDIGEPAPGNFQSDTEVPSEVVEVTPDSPSVEPAPEVAPTDAPVA